MTKRRTATRKSATNKKAKIILEEDKKKEEDVLDSNGEDVEEKPQMEGEEEPFDLGQLDNDMLNCVLEKLEVKETMTLMATSKSMMSFYESKAKFKIPFEFNYLGLTLRKNGKVSLIQRYGSYENRHFIGRLLKKRDPLRSDLQKLPFRFYLSYLNCGEGKITAEMGDKLKERLNFLKIDFINTVFLGSKTSSDVEIFKRSLGNVTIRDEICLVEVDPSSLDSPFFRRHSLDIFFAHGSLLEHMTVIQSAKLKFDIYQQESMNEMDVAVEAVIQKWSSPSSLEHWGLKFMDGLRDKTLTYKAFGKALEARNPIDFNTRGPLPNHRPLYFVRKDENNGTNHYYIAREDGSIVHIYKHFARLFGRLVLKVIPLVEGPPILVV